MNPLVIESTHETPEIILDKDSNTFRFSGKSLPENPIHYYQPVLEWLDNYTLNPNSQTTVAFKMIYFNTSSSKIFLDILKRFETICKSGYDVSVNWEYRFDDDDMLEAGEIYAERVSIPFNLIEDEN